MHATHSNKNGPLYERVAETIIQLIDQGTFQPGERVPSVRQLHLQRGVSISTVLQAYALLESRGKIEARPQSGFYVRHPVRDFPPEPMISMPSPAPTHVDVGDLVIKVFEAARDPRIISFGAACPAPDLFPTALLARTLASVARRVGMTGNAYGFPPGSLELRRQIARRSIDWGCALAADEIITTYGCTESLHLALRAVAKPGETVAVESPTYFGILQLIEMLQMKALEIPTDPRTGISLDALEKAIRKEKVDACIVTGNFNNPLGSCMPDENKRALVALLARRKIPLIEDDVYGDLYFGAGRPKAIKAFDREGGVVLCSSFSKTLAPGYRVGWIVPGRFKREIERLKYIMTVGTARLPELAIAEFLQNGRYDHYLRRIRKTYAARLHFLIEAIGASFPNGTKVTRPQGGYVVWIELPRSVNALALYWKALEKRIGIAPGPIFSAKRQYPNFIRLHCGFDWSDRMEEALVTLGRLAGKESR